jgi:Uma2 family endonuclease
VTIYCQEPPDVDGAGDTLPATVIEIVSPGYEKKDEIGLPFYLEQGIADVVLYDPRTREVIHATSNGRDIHTAPVDLTFACGCAVTIPL